MDTFSLILEADSKHIKNIFGQFDYNIKNIERRMNVKILNRDEGIKISGAKENVECAKRALEELKELSKRGNDITEQNVNYAMDVAIEGSNVSLAELDTEIICHTVQGKPVKPKTAGQKEYVDAINRIKCC